MKRLMLGLSVLFLATACGSAETELDPTLNTDGDCMTDVVEIELGTDPNVDGDADGDGISDCAELECVSDPLNGNEKCYTCGWKHNDPDRLESSGSGIGDTIANAQLTDQCNDSVSLWDLYGEYHVIWMTAAY